MINGRFLILLGAFWLNTFVAPVTFGGEGAAICFYLDKDKFEEQFMPVRLVSNSALSVELQNDGLIHGNDRLCQWSRNGGSGVREEFELDGNVAIPILDPDCESPFSHVYTGVGFGDWYLTLCGTCSIDNLIVPFRGSEYSVHVDSLRQWTEYRPGTFPIEGDKGY